MGVGEAGGSPPSHSLIADYVPVESRSTALGIFAIGVPLGLLTGYLLGGLDRTIIMAGGWRFWRSAYPASFWRLIVRYFTLDEPLRGHSQGGVKEQVPTPPIMEVVRHMWRMPTFLASVAGHRLAGLWHLFHLSMDAEFSIPQLSDAKR